jgi:hypothetical protein
MASLHDPVPFPKLLFQAVSGQVAVESRQYDSDAQPIIISLKLMRSRDMLCASAAANAFSLNALNDCD